MATDFRRLISHVVVVMMENRSFDHLCGYLSLRPWNLTAVDGLQTDQGWIDRYTNYWQGNPYAPHHLAGQVADDPPHDRSSIATQLGTSPGAQGPMTGFVRSYAGRSPQPSDVSQVMGYYTPDEVPIHDFFARNFAVCDRWFSAIPASTQPNRLMATGGFTRIDDNQFIIPDQDLAYDWLTQRDVTWRVYHDGVVPIFGLMNKWKEIIHDDDRKELAEQPLFRWFDSFEADIQDTTVPFPQVVFVEPDYADIPLHVTPPNDDHPPASIHEGQKFLRRVYRALTKNPDVWNQTLMIVTYDEHGGFFDHVEPLPIGAASPNGSYQPFTTTGPRVPAFLISPYVEAGAVIHDNLDHTSVLKFLGERFDAGVYSDAVERRHQGAVHLDLLSTSLTRDTPRPEIPHPPQVLDTEDTPVNVDAFRGALKDFHDLSPEHIAEYFGTAMESESP
jgi:phospholipase C